MNKVKQYIEHVEQSIQKGMELKSNADPSVFAIDGMSTAPFRSVLNNLCSIDNMTYLEIGSWKGGTLCGAICNNKSLTSYAIDNFSHSANEQETKNSLIRNIQKYGPTTGHVTFIEKNCFDVDKKMFAKPIDVYLFDGLHDEEDQRRALVDFIDCMNDVFIFIVDDYNWDGPQLGTKNALEILKDKIIVEKDWTFLTSDGWDPVWHNGVYFAVISKVK